MSDCCIRYTYKTGNTAWLYWENPTHITPSASWSLQSTETFLSSCHGCMLTSRVCVGDGVVEKAGVIMASHAAVSSILRQMMFGLHHCHAEVATLSVTSDPDKRTQSIQEL